jgi:PTH1 family peptidyl-tRNA hydrolase
MFFRKRQGTVDYVVAGLGNPGARYSGTRHNVGFRVVDELASRHGVPVDKNKFKAMTGIGTITVPGGIRRRVLFIKPQTYMNLSGVSLNAALSFYKIPLERVIVVFDDVSLPVGRIRIRKKGSDGGHNGIKSIIEMCGSEEFPRLKIGVGSPGDGDLVNWVTSPFGRDDRERIERVIKVSADAVEYMLTDDLDAASGVFNGKTVE